jgi:hypothetical protein
MTRWLLTYTRQVKVVALSWQPEHPTSRARACRDISGLSFNPVGDSLQSALGRGASREGTGNPIGIDIELNEWSFLFDLRLCADQAVRHDSGR